MYVDAFSAREARNRGAALVWMRYTEMESHGPSLRRTDQADAGEQWEMEPWSGQTDRGRAACRACPGAMPREGLAGRCRAPGYLTARALARGRVLDAA